jgi:hypothetical protein
VETVAHPGPSFLAELGVRGAYFSPGDDALLDSLEERAAVEEFLDAVRVMALFIAEHCGVESGPPLTGHTDASPD